MSQAASQHPEQLIRPVRAADIAAIADIYNHYITHTTVSYEEKCLNHSDMAARLNHVLEAGFPWLVAEVEGQVAGYCYAYRWHTRSAYRHTAEITVYLDPAFTGQGLGTALYQALFAALGHMHIRFVIGGISLPNPASVALHTRMGMRKVAHFEQVGFKFGQWLDVGYWQGELDSWGTRSQDEAEGT